MEAVEFVPQRYEEAVPLDALVPFDGNPRLHDRERIAESVSHNGFAGAVYAEEGTGRILAGHGRVEELAERGVESVPVIWLQTEDDAHARRLLVALNPHPDDPGYDPEKLAAMLDGLATQDALAGSGFDTDDVSRLLDGLTVAEAETDSEPEPPLEPVARPGDVWQLVEHRLVCGDATDPSVYPQEFDLLLTDPPYGVDIGAKNRTLDQFDRAGCRLEDLSGDTGIADVEALWKDAFGLWAQLLPPGCPFYVFGPQGGDLGLLLLLLLRDAGMPARHILIWVKNRASFSLGRLDYEYAHEPIAYGWKDGAAHPWHAADTRTSTLHFDRPQASPDHATTKPVPLLAELISNSTARGDLVVDPFAGSGSTLIAAHDLGRRAHVVELHPSYCDVICRRFEAHTGIEPVRIG